MIKNAKLSFEDTLKWGIPLSLHPRCVVIVILSVMPYAEEVYLHRQWSVSTIGKSNLCLCVKVSNFLMARLVRNNIKEADHIIVYRGSPYKQITIKFRLIFAPFCLLIRPNICHL